MKDDEIIKMLEEIVQGIKDKSIMVIRMRVKRDFLYQDSHDLNISVQAHVKDK